MCGIRNLFCSERHMTPVQFNLLLHRGVTFIWKVVATKNSTCDAGVRNFLKFSVQTGALNVVSVSGENDKLRTFHQKLCHACLKSVAVRVPPLQKVGGGAYAYPPPYSPHSTPMLHNIDRLGDLIVMYTGYYRACYVILWCRQVWHSVVTATVRGTSERWVCQCELSAEHWRKSTSPWTDCDEFASYHTPGSCRQTTTDACRRRVPTWSAAVRPLRQ